MLWLCLHFPHLAVELRQPVDAGCVAITDHHGARRWLLACNAVSRAAGLHAQLDAATALAREPQLRLIERSHQQEHAALEALAGWAQQFSNVVCRDTQRWLLWLEIGASLRYFGGLKSLLDKVTREVAGLQYTVVTGVAPTLEAAALLTHPIVANHAKENRASSFTLAELRERLLPLAIESLAVPVETIDALRSIGWRCIGEILALPRDALARRFGPAFTQYVRCLLGEQPDPREPYRLPATYQRCIELPAAIDVIESLLFPLRRILGELQGYLRARDTALQELTLHFRHERAPDTVLMVRTTTPERDAASLLNLVREHMERIYLAAPAVAMVLVVTRFVPLGDTQLDFFDERKRRDLKWSNLLDKLRARLGTQAVKYLGLCEDHRPEQAWRVLTEACESTLPAQHPARPLWLIDPVPITQLPAMSGKPERIEAGWWSGIDCRRDYFIADMPQGGRYWLYRDATTLQWYLHGIWA